ncbi:MAG: hypothetical protein U1E17_06125 [Geminicoccaceae bacterium]
MDGAERHPRARELPRTPNGKIDCARLSAPERGEPWGAPHLARATRIVELLLTTWPARSCWGWRGGR